MREICEYGSVGGAGGDARAYPENPGCTVRRLGRRIASFQAGPVGARALPAGLEAGDPRYCGPGFVQCTRFPRSRCGPGSRKARAPR